MASILNSSENFVSYNDPYGNPLIAFGRDGSIAQNNGLHLTKRYFTRTFVPTSQVLTLFSSPIQIVKGVSGYIPKINNFHVRYKAGSVVFNPGLNDQLDLFLGTTSNPFFCGPSLGASGFADQAIDQVGWGKGYYISINGSQANNSAMKLSNATGSSVFFTQYSLAAAYPTGSANWTLGNGSLNVFVEYQMIQVP